MEQQTNTSSEQIIHQKGDKALYLQEGDFVKGTWGEKKGKINVWGRIRKFENDGSPALRDMRKILLNKWRGIHLDEVKDLELLEEMPEEIVEFFDHLERLHVHTNIYLEAKHQKLDKDGERECKDCREGF